MPHTYLTNIHIMFKLKKHYTHTTDIHSTGIPYAIHMAHIHIAYISHPGIAYQTHNIHVAQTAHSNTHVHYNHIYYVLIYSAHIPPFPYTYIRHMHTQSSPTETK